eukprot:SAG11_NODE_1357_length_5120_cov_2.888668_4_plen_72_part_00
MLCCARECPLASYSFSYSYYTILSFDFTREVSSYLRHATCSSLGFLVRMTVYFTHFTHDFVHPIQHIRFQM